jgi:hypothetical protein
MIIISQKMIIIIVTAVETSNSCILFIVWYSKKNREHNVSKIGLFSSSGEREKPTLIGALERSSLNHWTHPFESTRKIFQMKVHSFL